MSSEMLSQYMTFEGAINDEFTFNILHLSTAHIWRSLEKSILRIRDLCEISYSKSINLVLVFMIVGILISIGTIFISFSIVNKMKLAYGTLLILIKHLSPYSIMQDKGVLNYILHKSGKTKSESMCLSQSVIHNSTSGILCTGLSGVIEIVNPAVSSLLGYTPEQLLGQPAATVFSTKGGEQVSSQIELMRNGQAQPVFECHVGLIDDSGTELMCSVVILGMKGDRDSKVSSFVIIFEDESEVVARQKEAESAKARSEELLYQILPRDIVRRLNQGEKDISFSVPSASVIFIDIVKFSDYAALLTPDEILGNLSTIFACFDSCCAKYPLLTKIKLIGDVYMAAGGLFASDEDSPNDHALQIVQFAVDCLTQLDEVNVRLNANLAVRIGINSGGPLLAGVLGTDKPVFDIIGDTINVASRLQSTDIPGRIQVSAATRELLDWFPYDIEERGEVYLKGKGNQKTFFVSPVNDFMASLSSHEIK